MNNRWYSVCAFIRGLSSEYVVKVICMYVCAYSVEIVHFAFYH